MQIPQQVQQQMSFDPWTPGFGERDEQGHLNGDTDPFNDDTIIEAQCDLENPEICESCT